MDYHNNSHKNEYNENNNDTDNNCLQKPLLVVGFKINDTSINKMPFDVDDNIEEKIFNFCDKYDIISKGFVAIVAKILEVIDLKIKQSVKSKHKEDEYDLIIDLTNIINQNKINNKKQCVNKTNDFNKFQKYQRLFKKLDSDHDGCISITNISIAFVNNDLLMELIPILSKLQRNVKKKISFVEFCSEVEKMKNKKSFISKLN